MTIRETIGEAKPALLLNLVNHFQPGLDETEIKSSRERLATYEAMHLPSLTCRFNQLRA